MTEELLQQEMHQQLAQAAQQSLIDQTGQLAKAPLMDPSKNPEAMEQMQEQMQSTEELPPEEI